MTELVINTNNNTTAIKVNYEPYTLISENDTILKQKTKHTIINKNLDEIIGRLKETLTKSKTYGISANQVGLDESILIIGYDKEYITMINPEIVEYSKETDRLHEGCLSFPLLTLLVERPKSIVIKFNDEKGNEHIQPFKGISANIIQHQYDLLYGITFDTLVKPLALKMAEKRRDKYIKRIGMTLKNQIRRK